MPLLGIFTGKLIVILVFIFASKCPELEAAAGPKRHVKFSDNWGATFPQCNPANNPYLSPINIVKKQTKPTNTRTLLTYSYDPIKNYTLYTGYYDEPNNIAMSALMITVDPKIFFECTYINGLGYENFQIFDKAVFFFSKSPLPSGHSFHTIDGKKFPMEIMFYFTNKQLTESGVNRQGVDEVKDTTQIFVLVEFQEEDNQVWFPVIEAARKIKKMKSRSEEVASLNKKLEEAKKDLEKLVEKKEKMKFQASSTLLKLIQSEIGKFQDSLEIDMKRKKETEKVLEELEAEAKASADIASYEVLLNKIQGQRESYQTKVDEIATAKKNPGGGGRQNVKTQVQLDKLDDEIRTMEGQMMRFIRTYGPIGKRLETAKSDIEILKHKIERNEKTIAKRQTSAGFSESQLDLKNGTAFKKALKDVLKLEQEMKQANQTINKTLETIGKMETNHFWQARMTTFQATWLFPPTGGYYAYNSSIPLPPCQRIRYTVVLKHPIKISKKQYDVLSSITAYDGYEAIDKMAAPMRELGERTVWYNKKYIQYQRDDGLHIKSIVRAQMKRDKKTGNFSYTGAPQNFNPKIEALNFAILMILVVAIRLV